MGITPETKDEQKTLWNGAAGRAWVDAQTLLDRTFKPFESLLASCGGLLESAACRAERCPAAPDRLAERCGESVHDDGRTYGRTTPARPGRPQA